MRIRETCSARRWRIASIALSCLLAITPAGVLAQVGGDLAQAERLIQRGRSAEAAALLERALTAAPSPRGHYLHGFALIQLYRFEEAEVALRRAVAADPHVADWHHALAKALLEQGKNVAAIEALERALAIEPKADYHFAKAMCALNIGDLELAEHELEACLSRDPNRADAHQALGRIRVDRGEWAEAAASLERALQIEPGLIEARYLAGLAASRGGRPEDARRQFEAVIAAVPGHTGALYNLGRVLMRLGETEAARRRLEEFRKMSEISDRAAFLERGVQLNPENVDGRLEYATRLLELGKSSEALEQLLAARSLAPARKRTYLLLAEAFRRLGREQDAGRAESFAAQLPGGVP